MSLPHSDSFSHFKLDYAKAQSDEMHSNGTIVPSMLTHLPAPKRARSPQTPLSALSALPDSERESQAKAKRLARFHSELSQPIHSLHDLSSHKTSANRQDQLCLVQQKNDERAEDTAFGGSLPDYTGAESPKAVIGLCPDMCPELERNERERKGDLDRHERFNGDRNQTSISLAVKKYNRMAERQAELIRPMPVLQKTVDYLLSLLDQPYDGSFLNIYNFLWDRMRAVRMDLRMQHIFNEDAIVMLEQMIRLHIIAMHELCEFKRGEGFTEGFDAHLNIEQMNKTSVELFHLYDDHRKQGKFFASEKEFRGYYALFKLDKHPGYKVEPAELSLDLAKMTAEIRSAPEILFARDVARACRIGNYIGFFRLARKATYLQACLMHAHFSKLRKQALASLHSGLQNNQGIPVAQVETWLAMEGENVEGFLEYHGFSIKNFEEAYMVKEGSFLNSDMDFPTKCSLLVQHKRSVRVVDDARSTLVLEQIFGERECMNNDVDIVDNRQCSNTATNLTINDELMLDPVVSPASTVLTEPRYLEKRVPVIQLRESEINMAEIPVMVTPYKVPEENVGNYTHRDDSQPILQHDDDASFNVTSLQHFENNRSESAVHYSADYCMATENSTIEKREIEKLERENQLLLFYQKEAYKGMLRRILRKWKKKAAMRKENRERNKLISLSALSSLSLGIPFGQIGSGQSCSSGRLNIDAIVRARLGKAEMSWSRLNISDLVSPIIAARNPGTRFICWKLIFVVQPSDPAYQIHQLAVDWLSLKLMGDSKEHDDELMMSTPCLSIWKKWTNSYGVSQTCLSVVRKIVLDNTQKFNEREALDGASCLVYLLSDTISWETQGIRLKKLCESIPDGSNLPLLILSIDSPRGQVAKPSLDIIRRLAFHDEDKRRICSHFVAFLSNSCCTDNFCSFFDDHQLRVGLQWLANNSPSMPSLYRVKTRELVLNNLRRYMAPGHEGLNMTPNDCVTRFNEALDKSAEKILDTASSNPTQWPAPEIDLLDKSSSERMLASLYFPSTGWSSPTQIEPLIRAIKSCKLPYFPDTSWLMRGSLMGKEIKQQKLDLEKLLISYQNESIKLLEDDLITREVNIMLQNCVGLQCHAQEDHELVFYLVPKWSLIFKRIYSWQLNKLTVPGVSNAYILDDKDHFADGTILGSDLTQVKLSNSYLEEFMSLDSFTAEVSLDELIKISFCKPLKKLPITTWTAPLRTVGEVSCGAEDNDCNISGDIIDTQMTKKHEVLTCSSSNGLISELNSANKQILTVSSSDRLTMLLERCNKLQDMIGQKLSIYF